MHPVARAHRHTRGRVVFIADTHLDADWPGALERFEALCHRCAQRGDPIYILGDLFDVWVGDDDDSETARRVTHALGHLGHRVPTWFMPGNRDFLIGAQFLARTNVRSLADPAIISVFGQRTALCHGDTLCTADAAYQRLRRQVRDPVWQARFLARPLAERRKTARSLRADSDRAATDKDTASMDVSAVAVERLIRDLDVDALIHGHTHLPESHSHIVDDRRVQRTVLPDWLNDRDTGVVLADPDGIRRVPADDC